MMTIVIKKQESIRTIATVYLVLFCIQMIPLEGMGANFVKVTAMALAPLVLLIKAPCLSPAISLGIIYYLCIIFCAWRYDSFRASTLIFTGLFLGMYMMFYNLIYAGAFTKKYFIKLMEVLITSYAIFLILQQIAVLVGIRYLPIINLAYCAAPKYNSLAIEASHAARILTVCGYAWLKTTELDQGKPPMIRELFYTHRWLILAWLYSITTLGSGTAFIGLAIVSFYFLKRKYIIVAASLLLMGLLILPHIDYEPLNRALSTVEAFQTLDPENLIAADSSAATRVLPIVNTINNLDLSKKETWFGYGIDTASNAGAFSQETMIGCITDYGLISYIFSLLLVFVCCIRPFFSLPTLMFWIGIGGGTSNITYGWGILMVFTCVGYFYLQNQKEKTVSR